MATTIITKYGSGAPTASDVVRGELAVDTENGRLYTEDSGGSVIEIGLNPSGNVDVTGTVTADGLTVDGNSNLTNTSAGASAFALVLQNQSSDTSTAVELGFDNTSTADKTSSLTKIGAERVNSPFAGDTDLYFKTQSNGGSVQRLKIATTGDISFYEDTGTTAKFFWDASAESLGIGTSSPSAKIHLDQGASNDGLILDADTAWNSSMYFWNNGSAKWAVRNVGGGADRFSIYSYALASDAVSIDSSGNVGIGTDSPSALLDVEAASPVIELRATTTTATTLGAKNNRILLTSNSTTAGAGGEIVFNTSDSTTGRWGAISGHITENSSGAARGDIVFATKATTAATSLVEAMRIDSSGNVGIGEASPHSFGTNQSGLTISDGTGGCIRLKNDAGTVNFDIENGGGGGINLNSVNALPLKFSTNNTERMRIDSSGNLLVNGTSPVVLSSDTLQVHNTQAAQIIVRNTNAAAGKAFRLGVDGAANNFVVYNQAGTGVYISDGATSWTANSDERVKENISDIGPVLEKVTNYRCVNYSLKATQSAAADKIGFIAQDWELDFPNTIHRDENDELSMKYTETIPVLLKAIQEQQDLIESLTARIAALEGAN